MMALTGCVPNGPELYLQAKDVYASMREKVAELQVHVYDGEWDLPGWGVAPEKCGSKGYRFSFTRTTPLDDGWWLPQQTTEDKVDALMQWLDQNGWSEVRMRTYSGGVTAVNIEAKYPDAHVQDILITVTTGPANDIVHLKVTGTCEPGDDSELWELMFPDGYPGSDAPQSVHPSVEPPFGDAAPTSTPES